MGLAAFYLGGFKSPAHGFIARANTCTRAFALPNGNGPFIPLPEGKGPLAPDW